MELIIEDYIIGCAILAWISVGIFVAYKTRNASCRVKILLCIVFTKGMFLFYFFNLIYTIIKQFIEGLKEGRAKKSEQDETNQNEKL